MRRILSSILANDTSGEALRVTFTITGLSDPSRRWQNPDTPPRKYKNLNDLFGEPENIHKFYRIITRVIMFIEDYITKATDPFPPRAYLGLPEMTSGNGRRFKCRLVDKRSILFTDLTSSERLRLLRGFLKYELVCRIYRAFSWCKSDYAVSLHEIVEKLLGRTQDRDRKVLASIHEYYRGVYGAIFAHCQASWLPDRMDTPSVKALGRWNDAEKASSPTKLGLLFPDNLFMDPDDSLTNQSISWSQDWQERYGEEATLWLLIHKFQLRVYRQRAWGLFDDERLYADPALNFPNMDDLDQLFQTTGGHLSAFERCCQRNRRRSQKWHDFYAGRIAERPLDDSEDEEYEQPLKDWTDSMPAFFGYSASRKLPFFWLADRMKNKYIIFGDISTAVHSDRNGSRPSTIGHGRVAQWQGV
ncbi:hypothetical protein FSARC_331 [Fusarium sarcochroum]|uniref:Uncharacterized protein n=1 Tax=Fusarium sarcochroum TaxID=1208366 RepID=A0A8H4XFL8_9HYPO|nr:hypothetical protein FSARC_331 [Fusarium sarcochroum]